MTKRVAGMRVGNRSLLRALHRVHKNRASFEKSREAKYVTPVFREAGVMSNPKQGAYLWLLYNDYIVVSGAVVTMTEKGKDLYVRLREKKASRKIAAVR